jgi:phasin family protein
MPSFPTNPLMRSGIDAQLELMTEFTRRSYEAARKLSELNLHFAQQMMQDATDVGRNMLGCSNPVQMAAVAARFVQPVSEHMRHYQQLFGVLSGVQRDMTRTVQTLAPQASPYAAVIAQTLALGTVQAGDAFTSAGNGSGSHGDADMPRAGAGAADSRGYGGNGARYTPG